MDSQSLLVEALLSAFFAVACFRSRAEFAGPVRSAPVRFFGLTNRLDRMRRSRWQWFAMVLLVVLFRLQTKAPIVAELTVLVQFLVFLGLPTLKPQTQRLRRV